MRYDIILELSMLTSVATTWGCTVTCEGDTSVWELFRSRSGREVEGSGVLAAPVPGTAGKLAVGMLLPACAAGGSGWYVRTGWTGTPKETMKLQYKPNMGDGREAVDVH